MNTILAKGLTLAITAIGFYTAIYFTAPPATAAEIVDLPPPVKAMLLQEMQDHIDNLDDIMAALAEGDFTEAATIATIRMTKGHKLWEKMESKGKTIEEIMAKQKSIVGLSRKEMRQKFHGKKDKIAVSQFAPQEFMDMGTEYHNAATAFATDAFKAKKPPTVENYQKAFENIQQMTAMCRVCHDSWDLK
ncbi:MAG: hypothetical protein OQJ97_15410 [Rhodospirillales bacterium]|nr:hypothetical protein [Rhodospirillales bacterium]